jgi:hypothetical protein
VIGPAQLAKAATDAQELFARTDSPRVLLGLVEGALVVADYTPENVEQFRRADRAGVGMALGVLWVSKAKRLRAVIARMLARRLVGPAFAAAARAETEAPGVRCLAAHDEAVRLRDELFAKADAPELRDALRREFAAIPALAMPSAEDAA